MIPGSYLPRDQAARAARNRRHFFVTCGVLAALVIARLALRHFGVI